MDISTSYANNQWTTTYSGDELPQNGDSGESGLAAQLADITTIKPSGNDDTQSIQNALNDGKNILLASGTFKISSTLNIPSNLKIIGEGKQLTNLHFIGCDGIQCNSNYVVISNLAIYTDSTTHTGIYVGTSFVAIDEVYFGGITSSEYWAKCIYLKNAWYSNFTNLFMMGGNITNTFNGYGIYSDYSVNNSFRGIMANYLDYGFYLSNVAAPTNGNYNEGWVISDCVIAACNNGFYADYGNYFNLSNNVIDMIKQYGIYLDGNNVGNGSFVGNWINITNGTTTATCIKTVNSNKNLISNNNLSNGVIGIEVDGWYTVISNNAITGFSDTGIHQYTGQQNTITGNTFVNNANYDIKCEGTNNSISGHVITSKIKWLDNTNAIQTHSKIMFTTTFTTVGGASKETITIPFPSSAKYTASMKPLATIDVNGDNKIFGVYMYDSTSSTNTQSQFVLYTYDSSVIPATTLRATITLSLDDSTINTP